MSFDSLAPYYRAMEFVAAGGVMQRCRTTFLADVQHCRRALLLGEGPGKFLVELLRHNPYIHVTCVERSPRMVAEAIRALQRNHLEVARVSFISAEALLRAAGFELRARRAANFGLAQADLWRKINL